MPPALPRPLTAAVAVGLVSGCADIDSLSQSGGTSTTSTTTGQTTSTTSSTSAGGSTGGTGGLTPSTGGSTGGTGGLTLSTGGTGGSGGFTTVFTIVFENHDYNEIVGSPDAPYINSLIEQYGLATNYFDCGVHPSLPNYLYLISGHTQYPGGINLPPEYPPYFPVDADNLGQQMQAAGIRWRSYQESMVEPCLLVQVGPYVPRHDPFLYFTGIQDGPDDLCAKTNVDYTQFFPDLLSGTYQFMWITPNLWSGGHDPPGDPVLALRYSDTWLSIELPKILHSPAYKSGGVVFLTWDEAEGRNGNDPHQVPMIVVSPKIKSPGLKVTTKLTHAAYLATLEELWGLPKLGAAASSPTLFEFFE